MDEQAPRFSSLFLLPPGLVFAGALLVLAATALAGLCLYLLLRFLLSRTPGRPDHRHPISPLAWLWRLGTFLSRLRARLAGMQCARASGRRGSRTCGGAVDVSVCNTRSPRRCGRSSDGAKVLAPATGWPFGATGQSLQAAG